MAVFPDKIVLKNSTDSQAAIETAIGSGGSDEIVYGELVIGRESGAAKLYTVDSDGNIAVVGGGAESIDDLSDVDTSTTPPTDGQALVWDNANSVWEPGTISGGGGGNTYIANYGDIYWSSVADQISFDGLTNASQNSWTNIGNNPLTWTSTGAITTSLSKWGTSCLDTEGFGSLSATGYALNQESFTLEAWLYWDNANRGNFALFLGIGAYSQAQKSIYCQRNNGTDTLILAIAQNSSTVIDQAGTTSVTNNAWHHVALVRDGTNIVLYVDGNPEARLTNRTDIIGATNWAAGQDVLGINDLRFTRGVARYEGGFVPPNAAFYASAAAPIDALSDVDTTTTPPTDGQALIWDNANSVWEPGTVAVPSLDPLFSSVTVLASFDGETNGASTWTTVGSTSPTWTANGATITNTITRWNGTTSLSVGAGAPSIPCSLGSSDFTIEAWVWMDLGTYNNFGSVFKNGVLADTFDVFYFGPNSNSTTARFRISNSSSTLAEATGSCVWQDEEWNHVAICRAGNTYSAYVNGDKVGSAVSGSSQTFNSGNLTISASDSSTGYIQDFRVTLGVARYSTQYYPVPTFPLPQT